MDIVHICIINTNSGVEMRTPDADTPNSLQVSLLTAKQAPRCSITCISLEKPSPLFLMSRVTEELSVVRE